MKFALLSRVIYFRLRFSVLWPTMRKVTVIARMLLLFAGPFGLGSWLCGLIFINKDSRDRGKQKMNDAMEKLKKEKTKLWVFPEGYRNHTGAFDEFKKGAFHMAIQGQVPIIPAVFSSYKLFMRKSDKVFNRGEVIIEVLPEISTKGLKSDDVNKLTDQVRNLMIKKYEELNEEVENKNIIS
jgi:lysophosphatidate acyltransferase